mgnify:FL=1
MAKGIRKKLAVLLAAAVMAGSFSGCGLMENTEIVFTTGLSGEQLFKIGKSVCTLPEAMIYVMDYQRQYEGVYGVEMWEHDFGGITFENYVKDTIVDQLASMKAITLLAGDYEVSLSSDEEKKVSQAAEDYYGALTEEQIEYMDLELKDVESLYRDHALSGKVYEEITKDVNTEVSDDEARIITVQQIRLDSAETAQSVKEQLDEGRDFAAVASSYSLDSQVTYTFGRGEHDAAYEEAAFALENDQVSDVIETEDGYYILKCVNNFDQEATEDNKVTMVEKRRDELFESVYEKLVADTPSQFNSRLWEKVHFADWTGEMPPDFLAIYEEYLGA